MIRRAVGALAVALLLAGCYPNEEDRRQADRDEQARAIACIERGGDWTDHGDGREVCDQ